MTWQRRHCVECWHDMEHCATCGCHDAEPVAAQADSARMRYNLGTTKTAPDECANTAEGLTNRTTKES